MVLTTILDSSSLAHPPSYLPRTTSRPTDQRSGELKGPALSAFLGDTIDTDTGDIPFSPVPPDLPACPYCHKRIRSEDAPSITAFASEHGLPASLCLNCTLAELEVLSPFTEAEDGMPVVFASLLAA